ncbi:DUF1304 domain-containing protein [Limosilactobacillus caccae]|uniref:DUF1304 domain-containing protein n=1 Tax=Limosilactobacillus caccae TaxID=1926284 RepID=UPI000970DAA2|nr:DUF1304 domain-containing protein [Limosilactobacillus caccae]
MLATTIVILVAIEHLGIMALEIWGTPVQQAKAFDLPLAFTKQREARVSFANQGIYNGMLGAAMIASYWLFSGATLVLVWQLLLVFVMVVALFGAFTATKKIIFLQFAPALLAFVLTLI